MSNPHHSPALGLLLLAVAAVLLGAMPSEALASRVTLTGSDSVEGQEYFQASIQGESGEVNDLKVVMASGVIEDDPAEVEAVGRRTADACRSRNRQRRLDCEPLNRAVVSGGDRDDRITVFGYTCTVRACALGRSNLDNGPDAVVDPGPGADTVRLDWGDTGRVQLSLRDGAHDTVECNGRAVELDIRNRDPEDDVQNCPRRRESDPRRDITPPSASISARRVLSRAGVLRLGITTLCTSNEAASCSVRASVSNAAARSLGIRSRARRFPIAKGAETASQPGRTRVHARLSPRARRALTGRRTPGLRVLLTAVVRDGEGNTSIKRFGVTIRG